MKVAEVKKICEYFKFDESTKKCRLYLDGEMCLRKDRFRCDLVMYKERQELKKTGKDVISVSKIDCLEKCPRLFAFKYVYRLDPPYVSRVKIQGKAFSDARASIDIGKEYSLPDDLLSAEKAKISAILRCYKENKLSETVVCERKVSFEYNGFIFFGYADSVTEDESKINEWKYSNYSYRYLKFIKQACVYLYGIESANKFSINVAIKPQHKMKENETEEEYEERIYKSLDPGKLFNYQVYQSKNFNLEYTLDIMLKSWKLKEHYEKLDYPPFYGFDCYNCDYHYICEEHIKKDIGCDSHMCATISYCKKIKQVRDGTV